jgi:hypothetical protein
MVYEFGSGGGGGDSGNGCCVFGRSDVDGVTFVGV